MGRLRPRCWSCGVGGTREMHEVVVERRDGSGEREMVEMCAHCVERPDRAWRKTWTLLAVRPHTTSPW